MMSLRTFNLLVVTLFVACPASAQSDFDDYVSMIRDSGMSESAASSVRGTASILADGRTFTATRLADGSVGLGYSGPPPGRSPRERGEAAASMESWTAFLKQQADTDHSGFVSTKEGHAIRRLVEMGLVADQLKLRTMEELEQAQPADSSEADLVAYAALRTESRKQGLTGMPALPGSLDRTPR
jgi:hypothetical protein